MKRLILPLLLWPNIVAAQWSNVGNATEVKGFSWTDPLWPSFWMAWTPATLAVFIGIFSAMGVLTVLEIRRPGLPGRLDARGAPEWQVRPHARL